MKRGKCRGATKGARSAERVAKLSISEILTIGDSSNARLFIPYRLDFHFIPSTHFPPLLPLCDISSASTEEFTPEGGSVVCRFKNYITSTHFPPLLPLCDISSASTEEFTPEGGSKYRRRRPLRSHLKLADRQISPQLTILLTARQIQLCGAKYSSC